MPILLIRRSQVEILPRNQFTLQLQANTMIRSGNSTRFTPHEVNELRQVGLDLANVKCQNHLDAELTWWAHTLADERFDLLERIAAEMAKSQRSEIASQAQRSEVALPFGLLICYSRFRPDRLKQRERK